MDLYRKAYCAFVLPKVIPDFTSRNQSTIKSPKLFYFLFILISKIILLSEVTEDRFNTVIMKDWTRNTLASSEHS